MFLDKWPPTSSGLPSTAGTTASCAFLRKRKLYIGHCGDSGIVLGRTNPRGGQWVSQALTIEHKPESPEELSRIESYGGKVQQKQGIPRVVWYRPKYPHQGPIRRNTRIEEVPFLAVARSLGDLWSYNYKTEKFVVSPEPDVSVIEVDESFKCLVFASDGLWNVMEPEASVDSVYETERRNDHNAKLGLSTWRNPSRVLVETALEKWRSNGLRADNTSVVCVMLDPPNKRQNFKFASTEDNARTIFDYSTSEAYNLDYMYGGSTLTRQNASYDLAVHPNYYNPLPSTSYPPPQPPPLTYETSSNESAFVKACCRNNYLLASAHETIPYHSSYEQHREMYESMALRPYPPLHYAYRPVPQQPLPSLHTNLYDHQGYLQNTYKPMERYNYLRPTPEEVAALHNEEEDSSDSEDTVDFSDEESDEAPETPDMKSSDDSVQIFEISSSNFSEAENSNDEAKKNNKENTEAKKKKIVADTSVMNRRFYATRQTDRKMRSGNVGAQRASGKMQRKITKNIKKAAKSKLLTEIAEKIVKKVEPRTEPAMQKQQKPLRNLRSAEKVEPATEKIVIVRSLRSNTSQANVMRKPAGHVNKHRRLK